MRKKPDIDADISAPEDLGESLGLMEPMRLGEDARSRPQLLDMALELAQKSAGFRRSLPVSILGPLARLVRSMNCYYSNLIEGHDTHPIDIERALANDYSGDPKKRNLQLEAKAHITVQQWIDDGGLAGGRAVTVDGLCEIHRRFVENVPEELCWVEDPITKTRFPVTPGELRRRMVQVGRHVSISAGAVPRFLRRFEDVFSRLNKTETILSVAAAHHRLAWIHPFIDGNGRVMRLMSHATMLEALDTGAVWSVAQGLARNVAEYKSHLANCDLPRRNDLDGRGTLSEETLSDFTRFFLGVCLDQVSFMEQLMEPARLQTRIRMWAEEEIRLNNLPAKAGAVLDALLYRGALPRNELAGLLDVTDRQARRIVASLNDKGVIASDGPKAPLQLAFPATLASRWMPGLFPDWPSEP